MPLSTYQRNFLSGDKQTFMITDMITDMDVWTTTSIKCLAGPARPMRRYLGFSQKLDDGFYGFAYVNGC